VSEVNLDIERAKSEASRLIVQKRWKEALEVLKSVWDREKNVVIGAMLLDVLNKLGYAEAACEVALEIFNKFGLKNYAAYVLIMLAEIFPKNLPNELKEKLENNRREFFKIFLKFYEGLKNKLDKLVMGNFSEKAGDIKENEESIVQEFELNKELVDNLFSALCEFDKNTCSKVLDIWANRLAKLYREYRREELLEMAKYMLELSLDTSKSLSSFLGLAVLYVDIGDYDAALELLWKAEMFYPKELKILDRMSEVYLRVGDLKQACRVLEKALQLNSDDVEVMKKLGIVYRELGEYDKAENILKEALNKGEDWEIYYNLGKISYLKGDYEAAQIYLKKSKAMNPNDTYTYNALGKLYATMGKFAKAIREHQQALERNPYDYYAYLCLAQIYMQLDRYDDAYELLERAVRELENAELKVMYAQLLRKRDRLDVALDVLQEVVLKDPANYQGHYNLGLVYMSRGEEELALREFEIAWSLSREDVYVANAYASLLIERGEYEKAERVLSKVLDKEDPYTLNLLGICKLERGDENEAKKLFERAIEKLDKSEFRLNLAYALEKMGKVDHALKEYEDVVKKNPNYALAKYHLGKLYLEKGDYSKALSWLRAAWYDDPHDVYVVNKLAITYMNLGRVKQAEEILKEAIKYAPEDWMLWYNLAEVYEKLGNLSEQKRMLYKALELAEGDNKKLVEQKLNVIEVAS